MPHIIIYKFVLFIKLKEQLTFTTQPDKLKIAAIKTRLGGKVGYLPYILLSKFFQYAKISSYSLLSNTLINAPNNG